MTALDDLGGEAPLRALVETFYDLVETLPEGSNLRRLHSRGHGIDNARVEQFNFLSGFMGGRHYYKEKHGHMDVKLMHAHVPIRLADAENWLHCMNKALDDEGHVGPHVEKLKQVFARVATILINNVPDWEDDLDRTVPDT
ncbi:group II truncated hemoglobin [Octadecabacter ascidiaceicola]|uniref:Group 2 truncated hemoglobin YjbI n=1 Tax=Octadecabacter ascidiaceicola TaxID=1655543 RepID=A0A238KIM5_9RHOB|nr:group II truncated hemoglobin [Octadecabacter ascidiaceicola]SMX42504.1 Group 2 truncated hemoglobin YjbI [Octadecabacter ascidiaceicola]